jgi:hypothetical protein
MSDIAEDEFQEPDIARIVLAKCRKCPRMLVLTIYAYGGWGQKPLADLPCLNPTRCGDSQPIPKDETGFRFDLLDDEPGVR